MSVEVALRHRIGGFDLDVAFTGPGAGVTALFGASGAGKSTILAAVAGLIRPRDGRIAISDRVLFDKAAGIDLPAHRRGVGVVFQDARLFPHLTVAGNIAYGAKRARTPIPMAERETLIDLLAIRPLLDRRPTGLSGGERQRVALARALAAGPRLLALDEPLAALDGPLKAEILPYLEAVRDRAGVPILYVSHAVEEVARLADHLVLLDRGRVAAAGLAGDLLARPDLIGRFGARHAGAVLSARVLGVEEGLARLDIGGQTAWAEAMTLPVGSAVRLSVRALDVTLSLDPPGRISANNVLIGRVDAIAGGPGPYADVAIALDATAFDGAAGPPLEGQAPPSGPAAPTGHEKPGTRLLARVTRRSADRLALAPGRPVYCLVKTVTLHHAPVA